MDGRNSHDQLEQSPGSMSDTIEDDSDTTEDDITVSESNTSLCMCNTLTHTHIYPIQAELIGQTRSCDLMPDT